jgi:hypothetical protein
VSWNLKQLFGIGAGPACPLAATSMIYIETTGQLFIFALKKSSCPLIFHLKRAQLSSRKVSGGFLSWRFFFSPQYL